MNKPKYKVEIRIGNDGSGKGYWLVCAIWEGVDRPYVGGYSTGKNRDLAERLAVFMCCDPWIETPEVCTDVDGKTYVNASLKIGTRYLNAELKRHGF
jgi:hypothetical protein